MKIYLLTRDPEAVGYDENAAMVVRAASPKTARKEARAAAEGHGDEHPDAWLSEATTVVRIREAGEPCLILRDFRAG
jgi:hypothetical protein